MAKYTPKNSFESLILSTMMNRMQLRPPYLDTTSFISNACDRIIQDESKTPLQREEAKLEKKILQIILSGDRDTLKPNSGQAVTVGDHQICVGFHEDSASGYRIWEWHGHIMLYDEEKGYTAEYIYGNYFERADIKRSEAKAEENESSGGPVGLGGLIDSAEGINARILCRNMSAGSLK
eukprot:Gb_28416 [translate_table: standard]